MYRETTALYLAFALLCLAFGGAHAERVWEFDLTGGTVPLNRMGTIEGISQFPIPFLYRETERTVYFFNDDGSVRNTVSIPENRVPRFSADGATIFLHEDIPFTSCAVMGRVEILNSAGATLAEGTYPLLKYLTLIRINDTQLLFQAGARDCPTLFLDYFLQLVQRYPLRVYSYVHSLPKQRIVCLAADKKTLRDRFGSIRNDNSIVCFDFAGTLLWQHDIEGLYVLRSMRMNGEGTLVHYTYLDESKRLHLVTYDFTGEKLLETELVGFGDVPISRIVNNTFATVRDGRIEIYRYPDISKITSFPITDYTKDLADEFFLNHKDGISISVNKDIALRYYNDENETVRMLIFDMDGNMLLNRPNLEKTYNIWNPKMIYRDGLYVLWTDARSATVEKLY